MYLVEVEGADWEWGFAVLGLEERVAVEGDAGVVGRSCVPVQASMMSSVD